MADDLKQGDCLASVHFILCQQIPRGDQAPRESFWEIDDCFMRLLLQVPGNSNTGHGKPRQWNLTNVHSSGLKAMLMVWMFNRQCRYQIQAQLVLDGH